MSKSLGDPGTLYLLEEPNRLRKKVRSAVTDSGREVSFDAEGKPGVSNLLTIYSALTGKGVDEIVSSYTGRGYGDLKKDLAEVVVDFTAPIRERVEELLADTTTLDLVLARGAERAREVAGSTLEAVYDRIGFLPPATLA
jgi:tryptophanyl-tRNA synthetase